MKPVVAIDGPSGVGKSTLARRLAARLGLAYLDTGAMYRAVALAAAREKVDPDDAEAVAGLVGQLDLRLEPGGDAAALVLLDGAPVGDEIRTPEISALASRLARLPMVRARLVAAQRIYGEEHGAVVEGRDIGTVVFPDSPTRFFLDARPEVRAERRWRELATRGVECTLEQVRRDLEERDDRDRARSSSPLACAPGAILVDTSDRTLDELVDLIADATSAAWREGERGLPSR